MFGSRAQSRKQLRPGSSRPAIRLDGGPYRVARAVKPACPSARDTAGSRRLIAASTYAISSALVIVALLLSPCSTASTAVCPAARKAQVSWPPKMTVGTSAIRIPARVRSARNCSSSAGVDGRLGSRVCTDAPPSTGGGVGAGAAATGGAATRTAAAGTAAHMARAATTATRYLLIAQPQLAFECPQVPTTYRIHDAADMYHVQRRRWAMAGAAPQPLAWRAGICVGDQERGWPAHGWLTPPSRGMSARTGAARALTR